MLKDTYTSTGSKFFCHQEAMTKLRNGKGQPIVTHVMLTDVCNHTCAFCSVQARHGDSLRLDDVLKYIDTLMFYGLRAVILSGGGNPILYKNKENNFNDVVSLLFARGLEIGLITNGMPLRLFNNRESWGTVRPETLDRLKWIRISMSGFDHPEDEVYVPDIDPSKTTLGFSYVAHDIYVEPEDKYHGKVSTRRDLLSEDRPPDITFESRIDELTEKIELYVRTYKPKYVRLLPNCLEPDKIPMRCEQLQYMADRINPDIVFVQNKPPKAPKACYLGYVHPVLNCDGYVYPCDSCVLNEAAGHSFSNPWRICHMSEIEKLYEEPVRSLISSPDKLCPGCVFTNSNAILNNIVEGHSIPLGTPMEHSNFV
jgi:MoaA/NifB/PqqE/SkfB family radical SAM enzyme